MEQLGLSMKPVAMPMAAAASPVNRSQRMATGPSSPASCPAGNLAPDTLEDPAEARVPKANVTEVILPPGQVENFQLLLPMLTQLNQERRWLAWIDPPQELVSKWQTMHGIVASELLVLRSTRDYSAFELAERALEAGTCHAVVMWTSRLSSRDFGALEQASARGQSHGVILRTR